MPYRVEYRDGTEKLIRNPTEFPDMDEISQKVRSVQEPMVRSTIIFPKEYLGDIMILCGVSISLFTFILISLLIIAWNRGLMKYKELTQRLFYSFLQ